MNGLKPERSCNVCHSTDNLKACSSCMKISYCSKDHQRSDWKNHKLVCLSQTNTEPKQSEETVASDMERLSLLSTPDVSSSTTNQTAPSMFDDKSLPAELPAHINNIWIKKTAVDIVKCLKQFGMAVIENFLGSPLAHKILEEVKAMDFDGKMEDGQTINILSNSDSASQPRYRTDKIVWVYGTEPSCQFIGKMVCIVDSILKSAQDYLTENVIQGRTQIMVACYPGNGSYYVKHVDNPNKDGRLLTCIYYLNHEWNCKMHGGMLKIYPEGSTRVASIEPIFDRLLFFWSDKRNPHEVLPSYRTRYAVTIWYFDANERANAVKDGTSSKKTLASDWTKANT